MLYNYFLKNDQKPMIKWTHYFSIYEKHFGKFVNQPVNFWEIGVLRGGSMQMWKSYLGPFARIIGIDIDPQCKQHEDDQVKICIGDATDTTFLQSVIDKYGPPDVVVDDGSHVMEHIYASFSFLYDKVTKNGVYLVEDLELAYNADYGGGYKRRGTFIEQCKDMIDSLNAHHFESEGSRRAFANSTYSMSFYSSVVVFEKTEWLNDNRKAMMLPIIDIEKTIRNTSHDEFFFSSRAHDSKCFIFGAGRCGRLISSELRKRNVAVDNFVDNDEKKHGEHYDGIEIISSEKSVKIPNSNYIIAVYNSDTANSIANQLVTMGISKTNIYTIRAL